MARLATHVLSYSENYNKSTDNTNNSKNKKNRSNNNSNNNGSDNNCNNSRDRNSSSMYMGGGLSKPVVADLMYTAPRPFRLPKKRTNEKHHRFRMQSI